MGFLNPGAWLFAGLFAVLIALYLWEHTRRRVDVPSLLLWAPIPDSAARTARFRPDWLFVLQCVLLLALIAGLADPFFGRHPGAAAPGRSIFVLDASASMQAREGRSSRFEMARAALRERIAALPADDAVMLIAAAHHPLVVAPFTHDHAELLRRLAALEPVDARANLDAALAIAQRAAESGESPARIELFTDTPREQLAERWRDGVGIFPVGETDDNLAIEQLQVFQGRFQDHRDTRAYVAVRNFAHREAHGILTLQLDDRVFSRRGFSLAPRSIGGFPLDSLPGAGVVRASLEVDDALAADNRAYGYVRPLQPLRVRVVTDDAKLAAELDRIGRATPNLRFEPVAPANYIGADGADLVLFHRVAPAPPPVPTLYVFPPPSAAAPFDVRGDAGPVALLDWNAQHPVLRALQPQWPFSLATVRDIVQPAWAEPLLTGRAGAHDLPLALAGEHGGQRRAVLAFDLGHDDLLGADRVDLLLFFLNLLDWLAPPQDSVRLVRTGEVEVVDHLPVLPRRVVDPSGRETTLAAGSAVAIDATRAGEYRVAADGTSVRVLASFADAEESDIGRARASAVAARVPKARAARGVPGGGVGAWLYAVAALLMLLEWVAARRSM